MFHSSADSMHFSRLTFWVGVLSLLQTVSARPGVAGLPQQSSQPTYGAVAGLGRTAAVSGSNPQLESTDTVNTLTGEVTSNANGTETQTFPNTTNSTPGMKRSLRCFNPSLPYHSHSRQYYLSPSWEL